VKAIPEHSDEIDAAWLTDALSERHPGVSVARVEVVESHEATNSHARLQIHYDNDAFLPSLLFCKLLPRDPSARVAIAATQMGLDEARFYERLAPQLSLRIPEVHVVRHDEASGAFVILMEDLADSGCSVPDGTTGVSADAAARALKDLARMHLRYRDPARRAKEAGWVREPGPPGDYGTSRLRYGLDHHRDRLSAAFAELAALYLNECATIHAAWDRGPRTVIHGDPHIGNIFDDDGRIGFLDWGLLAATTPMRDVSYFLTMSLSIEDRRAHEERLIRHWLDVWNSGGGDPISFDTAWLAHRLHAAYSVPACCQIVTFPEQLSEPRRKFAEAFLARAEAAVEDLEARDALRQLAGI
jgi:aminoglycoside phosphotransferase (APT) family kinase protein